jgi:hypothetical protein
VIRTLHEVSAAIRSSALAVSRLRVVCASWVSVVAWRHDTRNHDIRVGLGRRGRHEAVDLVFGTTTLVQILPVQGVSDGKRTQETGAGHSAQTARYPARAKAPGNSAG